MKEYTEDKYLKEIIELIKEYSAFHSRRYNSILKEIKEKLGKEGT